MKWPKWYLRKVNNREISPDSYILFSKKIFFSFLSSLLFPSYVLKMCELCDGSLRVKFRKSMPKASPYSEKKWAYVWILSAHPYTHLHTLSFTLTHRDVYWVYWVLGTSHMPYTYYLITLTQWLYNAVYTVNYIYKVTERWNSLPKFM